MRLLVTGTKGQVAMALAERAAEQGIHLCAVGRPEFDLTDAAAHLSVIADAKPDVIVSAAAYTAVDKAEIDEVSAYAVNVSGPGAVASLAADLDIPIVHISTDYVYDGSKLTPYVETDPTNPLGVYGKTKLAGEEAVSSMTSNHAILRTAWVYSPFGKNFLKTMLRASADRPQLRVVDDQRGNPTSALDIADAVIAIARNLCEQPYNIALRGIFHLAGTNEASWADFASEIFAISRELGGPSSSVALVTTEDFPTLAKRPINSRLNTDKLKYVHGVVMPAWQTSTRDTLVRLLADTAECA